MTDPYEILGVGPDASAEEIRDAYRKLAQQWHPDRHPNDTAAATSKFQEIAEAYTILSDAGKRARYDDLGDVEPTEASALTAAAIQLLQDLALKFLDAPGDHLVGMRLMCDTKIASLNAAIQDARMAIRKREQFAKRWKTKLGGRNIFANALRRDVQRLKGDVKTAKEAIEIANECLCILAEYEFQCGADPGAPRLEARSLYIRFDVP